MILRWTRGGELLLGLTVIAVAATANAETNEALSEALFQQAKALIAEGDYESACPKLAQSYRADPAGGTMLLLAMCYEEVGKTATAWVKYNEALALARRDGRDDRINRAGERIVALSPKLMRLRVIPSEQARTLTGFELRLDGTVIAVSSDAAFPVDPGEHEIVASSEGYVEWRTMVQLEHPGETVNVTLPILEKTKSAQVEAAPTQAQAPDKAEPAYIQDQPLEPPRLPRETSTTRILAWVGAGLAVAGLGATSYLGYRASRRMKDAEASCDGSRDGCTDPAAAIQSEEALDLANWANVSGAATAAMGGVSIWLFWISDESTEANVGFRTIPNALSVEAQGSF